MDTEKSKQNDAVTPSTGANIPVVHKHGFTLLSAVGLAFAILNSWTAMAASLSLALPSGGPTAVIWGVIVSGIGNICIAASLAEICAFHFTIHHPHHSI
jgi:hypothetical protein